MGDETWASIQQVRSKTESFREKVKKRKAERESILNTSARGSSSSSPSQLSLTSKGDLSDVSRSDASMIEFLILQLLIELLPPLQSSQICQIVNEKLKKPVSSAIIDNLLQKFACKELISISQTVKEGETLVSVTSVEHSHVASVLDGDHNFRSEPTFSRNSYETSSSGTRPYSDDEPPSKIMKDDENKNEKTKSIDDDNDVMSLLSAQSIRERETKKVGEEIMELLSKPTAKEQLLTQRFRSQGGAKVQEFCPHGTKEECDHISHGQKCGKLHFRKIIQKHTDESLGDCSFLNTCFHMDTCRYVHYEVNYDGISEQVTPTSEESPLLRSLPCKRRNEERTILFPPQWIQCDLRYLDMSILGKFAVIMADPPWDIHMELPYGTLSDDEMRQLNIPALQEEGLIFLWVTGRAMELGRECLNLWGYDRVDEIIWVKTNQLQRIIRTGRTGHWLNHGKEHCLVGMKGNPKINRWLDADVIVAEVRATSHKPDEIYGIIERLSPGTRKLELFGRPHNVQPNWLTLGNQLEGVNLLEEDLVKTFNEHYPDGICRKPSNV